MSDFPVISLLVLLPLFAALMVTSGPAAGAGMAGEWVSLFNGKDLSGWAQVNCAEETFTVRDGMIACTGIPTGVLRTDRMYENYVLEIEWRHTVKGGNAEGSQMIEPVYNPAQIPTLKPLFFRRGAPFFQLRTRCRFRAKRP